MDQVVRPPRLEEKRSCAGGEAVSQKTWSQIAGVGVGELKKSRNRRNTFLVSKQRLHVEGGRQTLDGALP